MSLEDFKKLRPYVPEQEFERITHDGVNVGIFSITADCPKGRYDLAGPDAEQRIKSALPEETILYIGSGGTRVRMGTMAELKRV